MGDEMNGPFEFRPPFLDWGSGVMQAPDAVTGWVKIGPLVAEFHRWWFRVGMCAGAPGYVGVYLGFIVVTIGRRRWREPAASFPVRWVPTSAEVKPSA